MKSVFWRGVALLMVGILAIPAAMITDAHALGTLSEAGRAATQGTNMNNSTARNFDLFPHNNIGGDNWVEVVTHEYDTNGNEVGNSYSDMARLVWGWNDWMLMCSLSNPANGFRVANAMFGGGAFHSKGGISLYNSSSKVTDHSGLNPYMDGEFFTAGIAMPSGEGGFAIGLGVHLQSDTAENTDGETNDDTASGFAVNGSWGNGDNMNIAAEVGLRSGKNENNQVDPATTAEFSATHFAAYGEYDMDDVNRLMAGFAFDSAESDDTGTDTVKDDLSNFALLFGGGRTLAESDDQLITAEIFVMFASSSTTGAVGAPNGDPAGETKGSILTIPYCRVTGSHQVSDRFALHAGVTGSWANTSGEDTAAGSGDVTKDGGSGASYDWSAGATGTFGPVAVDVYLNTENLGDILSLGNQDGLVGGLSASASF